jgi:hypothetical protein
MFRNPWTENYYTNPPDHGTAVASAAVGQTTGVANRANIFMVRMARLNGITQEFISTPTWVTYMNAVRDNINSRRPRRAVVNFSVDTAASGATSGMNTALANIIATRTPVFVAAHHTNNFNSDPPRSNFWPMNQSNTIMVGATDSKDRKYDYQYLVGLSTVDYNQMNGCDIFAPAGPKFNPDNTVDQNGIFVAKAGGGLWIVAGSSLAAPQAAGIAAMYLTVNSTYTPTRKMVQDWLYELSSLNVLNTTFFGSGDQNRLIYSKSPIVSARNAASFVEGCAPDSLATGFSVFGGTSTQVQFHNDSGLVGNVTPSFADSSQVNFYVPNIGSGTYAVKMRSSLLLSSGPIQLNPIAPGLFSWDGDSNGVAAGHLYLTDKVTGTSSGPITLSPNGNAWNPATHYAYLVCYGTGFRYQTGSSYVQLKKDSTIYSSPANFPLFFIGAVSGIQGQDQFNIGPLPDDMGNIKGTWDIKLFASGPTGTLLANIVQFKIN